MKNDKETLSTKLEYLYRDAANFKEYGCVLLEGVLSTDEKSEIISCLQDGEFFVAEQVGVPALYEKLYEFSDGPTDGDHCWHEFDQFGEYDRAQEDDKPWGTAAELLSRFRSVKEWDLRMSPHAC